MKHKQLTLPIHRFFLCFRMRPSPSLHSPVECGISSCHIHLRRSQLLSGQCLVYLCNLFQKTWRSTFAALRNVLAFSSTTTLSPLCKSLGSKHWTMLGGGYLGNGGIILGSLKEVLIEYIMDIRRYLNWANLHHNKRNKNVLLLKILKILKALEVIFYAVN